MNEQDCIELTIVEKQILDLEYKIKNYVPRDKATVQQDITELLVRRGKTEDQKPYTLNRNITINDEERLKALRNTGLNFNNEDWQEEVKILSENGVNLNDPKWKELIKNAIPILLAALSSCALGAFAIQQWVEGIINMIITVISFPINILVSFIKQLIEFITSLLGIPLNPVDVPDWAKGIITKFKELISFIIKLPTLPGVIALVSKVIDSILPGFIKFIDAVKLLITTLPSSIKALKDFISMQTILMSNLRDLYEKEKRNLTLKLNFKKAQLEGGVDKETQKENEIMTGQQRIAVSQLQEIQRLIKINPSLKDELLKQKDKYCKMLTDIEQKSNNMKTASQPKSYEDNKKEADDLEFRLNNLDDKYSSLFNGEKAIEDSKEKLKEMEDQSNKLSDVCGWNKNIDEVMNLLDTFMEDLKNQTNPFQKQAEFLNNEVIALIEELKKLNKEIEALKKGDPSVEENNLKKQIDDLNKQIKDIEDSVCANQDKITISEINDKLAEVQNLKKLRSDAEQALKSIRLNKDTNIEELEKEKLNLEEQLEKTKKLAEDSNNQSTNFNTNLNIDLEQFPTVLQWFPVATNILCNIPKMIVNILIAIINEVGRMENLPDLWRFEPIE